MFDFISHAVSNFAENWYVLYFVLLDLNLLDLWDKFNSMQKCTQNGDILPCIFSDLFTLIYFLVHGRKEEECMKVNHN